MSSSTSDILKKEQLKYIDKSYKVGIDSAPAEVVDILNDYTWINDSRVVGGSSVTISVSDKKEKIGKKNNIPFCYVIERRSAANAGIANIFNMINFLTETAKKSVESIASMIDGASKTFNENSDTNNQTKPAATNETSAPSKTAPEIPPNNQQASATEKPSEQPAESTPEPAQENSEGLKGFMSEIKKFLSEKTKGLQELLDKNNLNTTLLHPYRYLYITKETGKKYVFPLLTPSASIGDLKGEWGNGAKLPGIAQMGVDIMMEGIDIVSIGANLLNNVQNFLSGKGDDVGHIREMAKSYVYPQDGDSVQVNFTLYNTTRLNAWKQNYKFLYLFTLRNLPMRIDVGSFVPPVLYDVIVPGAKHLPVCCVSGINVVPHGMIRTLNCENFFDSGVLTVNVPEAWEVTITFKCLIGHSANLMLSGIYNSIKTETSSADKVPTTTA